MAENLIELKTVKPKPEVKIKLKAPVMQKVNAIKTLRGTRK